MLALRFDARKSLERRIWSLELTRSDQFPNLHRHLWGVRVFDGIVSDQ